MGIDWPLKNPLVLSAATVESNEGPRHAPAMAVETVRKLDDAVANVEILTIMRAFSAGILLMTYASLRFADVQKIRSLEANADSIHGALLTSKTKKQHGLHWPWACPRMGITKRTDWIQPLLDLRTAYQKANGTQMSYTFPRLDHTWALVAEVPSPYSTTIRKLALLCVGLGGLKGESYTLHLPKNLPPTASNQMSSDQKELDKSCPDGEISVCVWLVSVHHCGSLLISRTFLSHLLSWPRGRGACLEWDTSCLSDGQPPHDGESTFLRSCAYILHFAFAFHSKTGVFRSNEQLWDHSRFSPLDARRF